MMYTLITVIGILLTTYYIVVIIIGVVDVTSCFGSKKAFKRAFIPFGMVFNSLQELIAEFKEEYKNLPKE